MISTKSLCPVCYNVIPAIIKVGRHVWMEKTCPEHGTVKSMVERDPMWYMFCRSQKNAHIYNGYMIDITDRCNLQCQWCYHKNGVEDRRVEDIVKDAQLCRHLAPFLLSGGEPTMHPQLPQILRVLSMIGETILITNGIKLCNEEYLDSLIAAGLAEHGKILRVALSLHPESNGKDTEFLELCRRRGYKVASGLYVVDTTDKIDKAVELYKEYDDVLCSFRIKGATQIWDSKKPKHTMFVSDIISHLEKTGEVDVQAGSKVSFGIIHYNKMELKLVSWYNVCNIDLNDINCPPYYRAKDGNVYHMLTSFILNERGVGRMGRMGEVE